MRHSNFSRILRTSKSFVNRLRTQACRNGIFTLAFCVGVLPSIAMAQNQVTLEVFDKDTGDPVVARLEFTKSAKKLNRDRKILSQGDTWLAEQSLPLQPPPGEYEFLAGRGPEFNAIRGGFTVERGSRDTVAIEIPRSIDMHGEGWFSGDLGSDLDASALLRWQCADAVDQCVATHWVRREKSTAPKKSAGKQKNEPKSAPSPTDALGMQWTERSIEFREPHLGLAMHRWPEGKDVSDDNQSEYVDPYALLTRTDVDARVVGEVTQLLAADTPILLTHPKVRLARVLSMSNRAKKDELLALGQGDTTEFGKLLLNIGKNRISIPVLAPFSPKDRIRYKGPRGAGMLAEAVYWQALQAGLRLSPTAASGFGVGDTHLGYNRVYTYCDSEITSDAWWEGLAKGESFVTNGPLLRVLVNGVPPGTVQASYRKEPVGLDIAVNLAVRDPVDYLDVIFNGQTLYNAKLEDHYRKGEFPPLTIEQSGWLVIRVVTAHEEGYRLASTAPFYFEFDGQPHIDRDAVQFFLDWLDRTEALNVGDDASTQARADAIQSARAFWNQQKERATSSDAKEPGR